MVVVFVILVGVAVGAEASHAALRVAIGLVVQGALGAVLLDAVGILWRARSAVQTGHRPPWHDAWPSRSERGEAAVRSQVLWLMLRDTFQVSFVVISLVGGLTYMLLATTVMSLQMLLE